MAKEAVIVGYGRSAVARAFKGSLVGVHPIEYAAHVLNGVVEKVPNLKKEDVEDVIVGCAVQHKQTSMNIAKSIAVRAGMPESVPGVSINRFCSSSLQAIAYACGSICANQADMIMAGGVEDMTDTFEPYPVEYQDEWLNEHAPGAYMAMGITAENIVKRYNISRKQMDELALESHKKAAKARKEGKLAKSIIPVKVERDGNSTVFDIDEGIREDTTMERLESLKPCFIKEEDGGTVTAATSSQTSDAAAFVAVMSEDMAKEKNIKPIAKLIGYAVAGVDSTVMGLGPIKAVPKALKKAGLTIEDIDVYELNEAFAAQVILCIDELKLDKSKLNPYGGAMALGHPMGATGAFLTCKALDYLIDNDKRYALVTMCIGGGMGAAAVFERCM